MKSNRNQQKPRQTYFDAGVLTQSCRFAFERKIQLENDAAFDKCRLQQVHATSHDAPARIVREYQPRQILSSEMLLDGTRRETNVPDLMVVEPVSRSLLYRVEHGLIATEQTYLKLHELGRADWLSMKQSEYARQKSVMDR